MLKWKALFIFAQRPTSEDYLCKRSRSFGSLVDKDVHAQVSLTLNIGLVVRHFEVIVDEVDDKVGEPRVLPL